MASASDPWHLVTFFEPFVQKCCAELDNTFKKFLEYVEALHRTAFMGSMCKLLDNSIRNVTLRYQAELKKDKEHPNTDLLSQISRAALYRATELWDIDFLDTISQSFDVFLATAFKTNKSRVKNYAVNFPLNRLPIHITPFKKR